MSNSKALGPAELVYKDLTSAEKEIAERIISVVQERLVESSVGVSMKRSINYSHNIRFPKEHLLEGVSEENVPGGEVMQVTAVEKPVETYVKYCFRSAGWEEVEFSRESDQLNVRISASSGTSPRKQDSK